MRGITGRAHPDFSRILVIESGERVVSEQFIRYCYGVQKCENLDLLTCYGGTPAGFDQNRGRMVSISDAEVAAGRLKFICRTALARYTLVAILCTDSPTLAKWKWTLALLTRARVAVVNEYGGFFFLDLRHLAPAKMMLSQRFGVRGAIHPDVFGKLLLFPLTVTYLLLYAAAVHIRRMLRARPAVG